MFLPLVGIIGGCCCQGFFFEKLFREDPSSVYLVSVLQALVNFCVQLFKWKLQGCPRQKVPTQEYAKMVFFFFIGNYCVSMGLNYAVPPALYLVFKSAALISNMILRYLILNQTASWKQQCAVYMMSFGILIWTAVSSNDKKNVVTENASISVYFIGIMALFISLISNSYIGILQESISKKYGKYPDEAMLFMQMLSLPLFTITFFTGKGYADLGIKTIDWQSHLMNLLFNYICASMIFKLSTVVNSLTLNIILTIRKFVSLMISVIWFGSSFTLPHIIGTLLLFGGSLLYYQDTYLTGSKDFGAKQQERNKEL